GLIKAGIPGLDDIVNLLGRGLYFSDVVNTVSNRYAEEILTPEYGEKMDPLLRAFRGKLHGIINGIDYEVFDPLTDASIAARYDVNTVEKKVENKLALQNEVGLPQDPAIPVIGLIARLYDQKGLDLIADWDQVKQTGNGFVFSAYGHWDVYAQVVRGLENFRQPALWRRLQANAMSTDVSWANSADKYVRLYHAAIANHAEATEYSATAAGPYGWSEPEKAPGS